jgi:SAM-dependent methyltransferase
MDLEQTGVTKVSAAGNGANFVPCPVCRQASDFKEQIPNWGEWRFCNYCTLLFANPMRLPENPEALFDRAYRGAARECEMQDFNDRLPVRRALIKEPELWFFSPAPARVIRWLEQEVGAGATVLELGCGPGFFLHALRKHGFNAVGLDVAQTVVELNRQDGFQIWHGTVETVPSDFVRPDAIVSFFMIHHLVDPRGFFSIIRTKWPKAPIAVAAYGRQRGRISEAAFPPRTFTMWNAKALEAAFREGGYEPNTVNVPSPGVETPFLVQVGKVLKHSVRLPSLYRFAKRIQRRTLPRLTRRYQQQGHVVLAFGKPIIDQPVSVSAPSTA